MVYRAKKNVVSVSENFSSIPRVNDDHGKFGVGEIRYGL